ncbi:RHS repeat-associated core domain-containing protein, partial [Flavobacterium circumlabens]
TYYVYDPYGNLTYVIPPKADAAISADVLNGLCYQYKYDYRNRLVEKKLPGKQWEFIVYDKLDRPVATGPANSPFKDDTAVGWLITKYDVFGRPIYTGWNNVSSTAAARKTLQDAQNSATVLFEAKDSRRTIDGLEVGYANAIAPTTFKLLSVNYYDNYGFPGAQAVPGLIIGQTVLTNVKGLPTGTWTRVLSTPSSLAGETTT